MKRWLKRIALSAFGLLVIMTIIGATYEAFARAQVVKALPAPGRLVDVGGGRRIQLDCRGSGTPVVVFESGLDTLGSLSWAAVHDAIAKTTRACAYSRAGIMWSDADPRPFSSGHLAEDLHNALAAADETAPYVMVGHSLGGPYVLGYAARYGDEVAGIVFVDASHPEQVARLRAAAGKDLDQQLGIASLGAALAWTGLVRLLDPSELPSNAPHTIAAPTAAWFPNSLPALVQELRGIDATLAVVATHRRLGDRPIIVLTHGEKNPPEALRAMQVTAAQAERMDAAWQEMQNDMATWSTNSRHEVVAGASHYIQFDQAGMVVRAVQDVVRNVRQREAADVAPTPNARH